MLPARDKFDMFTLWWPIESSIGLVRWSVHGQVLQALGQATTSAWLAVAHRRATWQASS